MTQDHAHRRTVLVTGGAGYIGSHACKALRRAGDPPVLVAGPARAMARLGWRPVYVGLEDMVATAWRRHAGRG